MKKRFELRNVGEKIQSIEHLIGMRFDEVSVCYTKGFTTDIRPVKWMINLNAFLLHKYIINDMYVYITDEQIKNRMAK